MLRALLLFELISIACSQTNSPTTTPTIAPTPSPSSILAGVENRFKHNEQLLLRNVRCRAHGFNAGEVVVSDSNGEIDLPTTHDANELLADARNADVAISEKFRLVRDQATTVLTTVVSAWSASSAKTATTTALQTALDDAAQTDAVSGSFTLDKAVVTAELEKAISDTRNVARSTYPTSVAKIDKITLLNELDVALRQSQAAQTQSTLLSLLGSTAAAKFAPQAPLTPAAKATLDQWAQLQQQQSVEQIIANKFGSFSSFILGKSAPVRPAGGLTVKPAGVIGGLDVAKKTDVTLDVVKNVIGRCTTGNMGDAEIYPTVDACLGALLPQDAAEFIGPRLHWMDGTDLFSQQNSDDVATQACLG